MTGAAITAVLWDIGNVIVRWDPRTLYTKIFPDPVQCDWFLSQVCTLDWHAAHDRGVTFAENRIPLIARFPQFEAEILAWETRWPEMFSGPIPETETAIAALAARGVDQFGVTNMSQETFGSTIAMSPSFDYLKDYVVSGRDEVMKPDRAFFDLACRRFGVTPGACLFVDDSAKNIAAAHALGFATHHYVDPADLWPGLSKLGLVPASRG